MRQCGIHFSKENLISFMERKKKHDEEPKVCSFEAYKKTHRHHKKMMSDAEYNNYTKSGNKSE